MSVKSKTTMSSMTIKSIKSIKQPDTDRVEPVTFVPFNWLKDAKIYNKRWLRVSNEWLIENADIVVLVFTAKGVDREGVMKKFYHVYESTKYVHIPIEVIFLPMDETEDDAVACFKEQANWFTLRFDDVLVHTLKFMYGITCIPYLLVFNTKCEVISYNGIADLDMYGKNAVVSWLSLAPTTKRQRRRSEDAEFYGPVWRYVKQEVKLSKYEYQRRFKEDGKPMAYRPDGPGRAYQPGDRAKADIEYSKPPEVAEDYSKPPDSAAQHLEGPATSAETHAKLPEGKPSVIQIRLPEDRFVTAESHALLADEVSKSRNDLERSSADAVAEPSGQPSESHARILESDSKPSKLHVHLPDDAPKSESHTELSESRSKSATQSGQTSETNVHPTASRSKSAKFADDL